MGPGYFQRLHRRQASDFSIGKLKTQNAQTRRCAEQVNVKCVLLQQQARKCAAIHVDAQNSGANAAINRKAAASMRELYEGALGAACTGWQQGITGAVYRRDDS